jgi:hypothetical protein
MVSGIRMPMVAQVVPVAKDVTAAMMNSSPAR